MIKFLRKYSGIIIIITFLSFALTIPAYYFGSRFYGSPSRTARKTGPEQLSQIARVNGEPVSVIRFLWLTNQLIKMQTKFGQPVGQSALLQTQYGILNDLIDFTLIQQEARRNKIVLEKNELEKNLENLKLSRNFKNNQQLDLFLKREKGISLRDYKQLLKEELIGKKLAESVRNSVTRNKNETEAAYARRQFASLDQLVRKLKTEAKIEILYPHLLAFDYIAQKKYDEAIKVYQNIIKTNPADIYGHLFLGQIYLEQNKNELALGEIKQAAQLNETSSEWRDPEVYVILSQAYLKNNKKQEAKTELDKASLIAGDNLSGHQALYLAYTQLGAKAEAEQQKQEILRIREKMIAILKAYQDREATLTRVKGLSNNTSAAASAENNSTSK